MTRNFEFAYDMSGNNRAPVRMKLPVAATQTIVAGDALEWSSGKLAKSDDAFGKVVAIAAEDSDGADAGTLIEVEIPMPWHVWRAWASAAATAIVNDGTASYDITSAQLVNIADTTGGSIQVVDIDADDPTRIYIQFAVCYFAP